MTSKAEQRRRKEAAAKHQALAGATTTIERDHEPIRLVVAANDYTAGADETIKEIARRERRAGNETMRDRDGSLNILARDGLLWLTKKNRLTIAQRMAAEDYRKAYKAVHIQGLRSCLNDQHGGSGSFVAEDYVKAVMDLDDARTEALNDDARLIWLVDEVAGKGSTLRDLAKADDRVADRLLAQFEVACDLLAAFYGFASKKQA